MVIAYITNKVFNNFMHDRQSPVGSPIQFCFIWFSAVICLLKSSIPTSAARPVSYSHT